MLSASVPHIWDHFSLNRVRDSSTKRDLTRGKTQWEVFQGILGCAFSARDFTVGPCPSVSAGSAPGEAEGGNYLTDCKYLPEPLPGSAPWERGAAAPGCSCCPNLGISAGWDESRRWKRCVPRGDSAELGGLAAGPQPLVCHGAEAARPK